MTIIELTNILQAATVGLAALGLVKLNAVYRLDDFRQKMFALRDELFDYAADGNISFTDPAYLLLRDQMNALIRYGHQLTFYRLLLTRLLPRRALAPRVQLWGPVWQKTVNAVKNPETKQTIERFYESENFLKAKQIVATSPVLLFISLVGALTYFVTHKTKNLEQVERATVAKMMRGPIKLQAVDDAACVAV